MGKKRIAQLLPLYTIIGRGYAKKSLEVFDLTFKIRAISTKCAMKLTRDRKNSFEKGIQSFKNHITLDGSVGNSPRRQIQKMGCWTCR